MRARDSMVYTPVSLGPDTDDEETLVNAEVYSNDLAQIRALVESTGMLGGSTCPSCEMPFDKGKKRRLIDSCGHERCYSCLFRSEACPLCLRADFNDEDGLEGPFRDEFAGTSGPMSILAPTDGWIDESSTVNSLCGSPRPRTKVTTRANLPSRVMHRDADEVSSVSKGLKNKSALPESSGSQGRQKLQMMTQSCPTPPNQRKRFFLNPKVLRSSFVPQRSSRRGASSPEPVANDNPSALSVWMTSSWEGKSRWPGVVLGKIKSLWSNSQGTASDGLNQLIEPRSKLTDDEGGCVKPLTSKTRKSSQSDLYMRLGLLLGSNHARANSSVDTSDLPGVSNRSGPGQSRVPIQGHDSSAASFSSLTSFETQTLASTNTSPVSTLTGTSSEAEAAAALRCPIKPKSKAKGKSKSRDCDSAGSLASISTSVSASTSMSMSMSVSVSGLSNGSSSPLTPRRHSVNASQPGQSDEPGQFKNRRSCARRSARTGNVKGAVDAKLRFIQHHATQLTLKPLFFEVPLLETDPLFTGRQWLLQEIDSVVNGSSPGVLISGSPGTGKTALVLQLVEHSCFGRRREQCLPSEITEEPEEKEKLGCATALHAGIRNTNEKVRELASHVVAYHFCQADNNSTCLVPDLIHSLAAQLCQAPQLISYREYLLSEPHIQGSLSQRECTVDPDLALSRGIIEPLSTLKKMNRLPDTNMVILIDAVCEAEYHRPDRGDTIASFLTRHAPNFPSWLKIICTVRTQLLECGKQLPYTRVSLDKVPNDSTGNNVTRDLSDYIGYRLAQSPAIQTNVTASVNGKAESSCSANQTRFASHLLALARGSFLFAKLTLDLIESGHLVAKSASYKVLPVSLAQIFQLHFNLRFPTATSFDRVQPLLGVCLAALYPLTLPEIFYSVNSLNADRFVSWEDFLQRFKMLSGFLVKRLDNTYMFFHPSFREWLMRRDEGESTKFLCDLRLGHAAIAYRLSRLQAPLDGDKALELGHHILKAHVYRGVAPCWPSRDLQAIWLASSTECVSSALCTLRNIYSPNVKVSRLLLLAGASPNHITEYLGNAPALCMYAHEGSVEMVSLLLEFGADVELTNSQGCTALSLAAARGHCDVVRRLAAAGASLGHADMAGQCPLVHAARHGRLSVVGYLLACDWVVPSGENEAENSQEMSREEAAQQAVVAAAAQGHESIVEYLLDMAEVIVDRPDTLIGETALTIAAANGSTATVSALLARGARPTAVNAKGLSPLMLAAREGHWGTAERFLQGTLSSSTDTILDDAVTLLDQRDLAGRTALMLAASEGHTNLIELFLDKGSILESRDKEGLTALCWACVRGRLTAVQNLIDRGADVNTSDNTGRTPLDLAAFQGNPKLVQLLLEKGAAVEHVDLHGMRPLDRAIGCRNIPVVQCFLRRGAKLGPATWAMAAGKPDVLLILLNKLLEDGNVLYRKNRLKEASHRYAYALRKFPVSPEEDCQGQEHDHMMLQLQTFAQLRLNFLLNLSRCKRKMNECAEAIELADEALKVRPVSYEAFYARAKARVDSGLLEDALSDVQEALQIAPPQNRQDRRVLVALRDEIISRLDGVGTSKGSCDSTGRSRLRASVDTLTEL
ncbi:zinc-RING finger and ankyrin repeat domain-containing protein rolling pebbles isoform X1 [Nomia melanderi]|uniref:zinc-RING finger and ankyrin repeat domain-containing protein rolling pebbles isoform X1 n=1 Tax=Nomia melanderi TaxID=2448451 RepID=UPI0013044957|nr:protein TANC2 isoform X1 [Nomia melanderi]XP_031847477.1 protein TANC2 isoform X1 [Nomia melanderi]